MTEPAARAARVRLFVALELPGEIQELLVGWVRPVLGVQSEALRGVRGDALHVTLCFLGGVAADAVPSVLSAVAGVGALPAAPLQVGEGVWLPPRRPRVLAVALADPSGRLGAVQSWLSGVLAGAGFYRPERRPYLPHVTVARVRSGARIRGTELAPPEPLSFTGSRVTVFRSLLSPAGARYEPLGSVELGA